jgi:PST family polysaccharide transporter
MKFSFNKLAGVARQALTTRQHSPFSAGGWATVAFIISGALSALLYIPLARLLTSTDFGLYAEAVVIYSGIILVLENTLIRALVRTPGERDELALATLWLSALAGLVGAGVCALAGWPMSVIYNDTRLIGVFLLLAPGVLAVALSTVPYALLTRELDFRRKLLPDTIGAALAIVAGIGAALLHFGVYSLIIHTVALAIFRSLVAWLVVRWRPVRSKPNWALFRQLLGFGLPASGGEITLYARFNIDTLLGGYRLGTDALGVYSLAWSTAERPAMFIKAFFGEVGYAAYARLQQNRPQLIRLFLTSTRLIAILMCSVFLSALFVRQELVGVIFGNRWQGLVEPLLPLVILQVLWLVAYPSVTMVLALGHSRVYATINTLSLLGTFGAVLIGSGLGIVELSWAMLLAVGLTSLVWIGLAFWYLRPGKAEIWQAAGLPLLFTLITVGVVAATQALFSLAGITNSLVRLAVAGLVGLIAFVVLVRFNWVALRADFNLLRQKLPQEESQAEPEQKAEQEAASVGF